MKKETLAQQYINIVSLQSRGFKKSAPLERLRVRLLKQMTHDELANAISFLIEQKILGVK